MAIQETRTPYEFLARWDESTGRFRGAHIQFYDRVLRDGVQIAGGPSKAFGVGDGLAFPLADIITTLTADALTRVQAQDAQIAALTAERDAAVQAGAQKDARIAELEAQLAAVQPPTSSPDEVPFRFGAAALLASGWFGAGVTTPSQLDAAVEGFITSLPDAVLPAAQKGLAILTWRRSASIRKRNPLVLMVAQALGKTMADVDAMFAQAKALEEAEAAALAAANAA